MELLELWQKAYCWTPQKVPEVSGLSDIQRLSGVREGTYTVGLVSESEKTYSSNTSLENWSQLEVGQVITGHVRRSGHLSSVDWPTSIAA